MEKLKLKSGRELEIKKITLDERDKLCDSIEYSKDGLIIRAAQKTITSWLRTCLNGQATDEFILSLSFEERADFFHQMQEKLLTGEGSASNSN